MRVHVDRDLIFSSKAAGVVLKDQYNINKHFDRCNMISLIDRISRY